MLQNLEFYTTPTGDVMIVEDGKPLRQYNQSDRDFTASMLELISEFYPEAFTALSKAYLKSLPNKPYHEYLMVCRFIRCNFGVYDNRPDVDPNSIFRFEAVPCPQRCECPFAGVICSPRFNASLSDRERQVMRLYYHQKSEEEIADELCISPLTVLRHKQNAFLKLKLHSKADFIAYAAKTRMFEAE